MKNRATEWCGPRTTHVVKTVIATVRAVEVARRTGGSGRSGAAVTYGDRGRALGVSFGRGDSA